MHTYKCRFIDSLRLFQNFLWFSIRFPLPDDKWLYDEHQREKDCVSDKLRKTNNRNSVEIAQDSLLELLKYKENDKQIDIHVDLIDKMKNRFNNKHSHTLFSLWLNEKFDNDQNRNVFEAHNEKYLRVNTTNAGNRLTSKATEPNDFVLVKVVVCAMVRWVSECVCSMGAAAMCTRSH